MEPKPLHSKWLVVIIIIIASVLLIFLVPAGNVGDVVRQLAGIPAVGALVFALYTLFRDQIAHERAILLLEAQNTFSIGATSHMANVAFDKHVSFCEEYVEEMFQTLSTLFQMGPTGEALKHAEALFRIRQKWALWLTVEIETKLDRFESAVRKIGANAHFVDVAPDAPEHQERINEMFALFAEVVGRGVMGSTEWEGKPIPEERAIQTIIGWLRKVLVTEELTRLRSHLVAQSLKDHPGKVDATKD